jgi:hypothetical protein
MLRIWLLWLAHILHRISVLFFLFLLPRTVSAYLLLPPYVLCSLYQHSLSVNSVERSSSLSTQLVLISLSLSLSVSLYIPSLR